MKDILITRVHNELNNNILELREHYLQFINLSQKLDNEIKKLCFLFLHRLILQTEQCKRFFMEWVMEISHTGNAYINGSYINTEYYETTKAGDVKIKNFTDDEIIKLIKEAIHNIQNKFI